MPKDAFFESHYAASPKPPRVPFRLRQGERLLLIGDSITEARRFSRMIETYLAACRPSLHVDVRNLGKGGETAQGFLQRMDEECLVHEPTAAILCYGMNDAEYTDYNRPAAKRYCAAMRAIVQKLKSFGTRIVLGSPGCIGRVPAWESVAEASSTLDGINTSLLYVREEAALIAEEELRARMEETVAPVVHDLHITPLA